MSDDPKPDTVAAAAEAKGKAGKRCSSHRPEWKKRGGKIWEEGVERTCSHKIMSKNKALREGCKKRHCRGRGKSAPKATAASASTNAATAL